jgi:hypothetical protein
VRMQLVCWFMCRLTPLRRRRHGERHAGRHVHLPAHISEPRFSFKICARRYDRLDIDVNDDAVLQPQHVQVLLLLLLLLLLLFVMILTLILLPSWVMRAAAALALADAVHFSCFGTLRRFRPS